MLELGLPRIRTWLRERVGDSADVAQITAEGGFIHVDGIVLPIGARGVLALDRASIAITANSSTGAGLPEARLHAFRGVLRFGAAHEPSFVAAVSFQADPQPDVAAWVAGELVIEDARWSSLDPARASPMQGAAKLVVTSTSFLLDDGHLSGEGARVRFSARGPLDASASGGGVTAATLVLEAARIGPFLDAATAIVGRTISVPPGVPGNAALTGEIAWDAATGGTGELSIDAEGLALRVSGKIDTDRRSLDARIEGTVRPAVPMRAAGLSAKVLPRDEDVLTVALEVSGEVTSPVLEGRVHADGLAFRMGRPRFAPPAAAFREIACEIAAEGERGLARVTALAGAGALTVHVDVPLKEPRRAAAHLWLKELDSVSIAALLSALDVDLPLPRDAHASIELRATRERVEGEASVVTPRSRVVVAPLALSVSDRDLSGTRISGDVAFEDALTLGLRRAPVHPTPEGAMTLDLVASGALAKPTVSGTVESPRLALAIASSPDHPPHVISDVRGSVVVTRESFRYEDLRFRAHGATLKSAGTIPFSGGSEAVVSAEGGSAFIAALARLGPSRRVTELTARTPEHAAIRGELRLAPDVPLAVDLAIDTRAGAGTAMVANIVRHRGGRLDGSSIRGDIAIADVLDVLSPGARLLPLREGLVHVDAVLREDGGRIGLTGYAASARFAVGARGIAIDPVVITHASALFRLDSANVRWTELEASVRGGSLTSSGSFAFEASVLRAIVGLEGVDVAAAPAIEAIVRGRLSADAHVERRGRGSALRGEGTVQLDGAAFPVFERTRGPLSRYGLEPPDERANAPATAKLRLRETLSVRDLRVSVPGCVAEGKLEIAREGGMEGGIVVTLDDAYLGSSRILRLPSVLAERLTIPVRIGGSVHEPQVNADLAACFGRFMTENRVSAFVSGAVDEALSLFGRGSVRPSAPPEEAPEAARPLSAELASVDWSDASARLAEHRRRWQTPADD